MLKRASLAKRFSQQSNLSNQRYIYIYSQCLHEISCSQSVILTSCIPQFLFLSVGSWPWPFREKLPIPCSLVARPLCLLGSWAPGSPRRPLRSTSASSRPRAGRSWARRRSSLSVASLSFARSLTARTWSATASRWLVRPAQR